MKGLVRPPLVYVTAAAAFVALLAIARPVWMPTAGPAQEPSNDAVASAGQQPIVPVVDLKLDRLRATTGDLPASSRDPFRFRPAPPPPPVRVPTPTTAFVPPAEVGPPPLPAIPIKYFGVLTIGGQRVASFVDARGNTFTGKEGDILEGRYRVVRIREDFVELAYLDGRGQQTIRLTGQ